MQQIICPNCGETVQAENINIQQMVAVCQHCNTVFQFDTPAEKAKAKRRKVKKPDGLSVDDTGDRLTLNFRTNFRLDKDATFLNSISMSIMFSLISYLTWGEFFADGLPIILPIVFTLIALTAFYRLGLRVYNKTHIELNADYINVSRRPIPNFMEYKTEISQNGLVRIYAEETDASKEHQYDTPRFTVWADRASSTRTPIVSDVTEDYAFYIAQQLQAYIDDADATYAEADTHTHRLEDSEEAEVNLSDLVIMQEQEQMDNK